MKKVLALLFALVFAVALFAACGDDEADIPTENNNTAADEGYENNEGYNEDYDADTDAGEGDDYGMVEEDGGYYQDFTFINSTGQTLVELRASAGGSGQWRDNMLEGVEIGPEESATLSLYIIPGDTTDFRVVADNGAEHELRGYELENFSTMELMANDDGSAVIELS